jgi:hypothetical protein
MSRHPNIKAPPVSGMQLMRRPGAKQYLLARSPTIRHDRAAADRLAREKWGDVERIGSDARWYIYQEKSG